MNSRISLALSFLVFVQIQAAKADDSAVSLVKKGESLAKSGRWQDAEKVFLEACSKDPANLAALHDLAVSYAHMDKLGEAAECERKALAIDEGYVPAHIELGCVLSRMNEKEKARVHLKRALELEPGNKIAARNLDAVNLPPVKRIKTAAAAANVLAESSAKNQALEPELKKLGETPVSKALIARGTLMYRQGKLELSRRLFEQALANCPDSISAHLNLGVVLGALKDYDGQLREEKRALELDPKNAAAFSRLAWAYAQKGELKESLSSYQRALELDASLVDAQAGQGLILFRLGKQEESLAFLSEAIKKNSGQASLHHAYGAVLAGMGRKDEALSELKESVRLNPAGFDARARLAALYLEQGEFNSAGQIYKLLVEQSPLDPELRIGFGLALMKTNELNQAYQQFKKASELDKNHAAAHACLSMIEEMRGKISQADHEAKVAGDLDSVWNFLSEPPARKLAGSAGEI